MAAAQDAERRGQSALARERYEAVLHTLHGAEGLLASDLARWIARTHCAEGDLEASMDCAALALHIAEAHGNSSGSAYARNLIGTLHQSGGDLDGAMAEYTLAHDAAQTAGNQQLLAMIEHNRATLASIRGAFDEALQHYHACLAGFRSVGLEDHVGYVLNNLGMLYTDLGRWDDAEQAFADALQCCEVTGNVSTRLTVLINSAELFAASDRIDEAEAVCEAGWKIANDFEEARPLGELNKVHGMVLRERGMLSDAEDLFRRGAELATRHGDILLLAEVCREEAILFALQDRNSETLDRLNRSHRLFMQLEARRDLAEIKGKIAALEETFLKIVRRWGESIESADAYTQGHCARVAHYACALASAAGFPADDLLWLEMGAMLHDIGKIVVPAEILNKPGGFTPEERLLMERHPVAGVEVLGDLQFPWDIRPMIRYHHERWVGGGYPSGIGGEEIPLAARILAIADVFDALSSDRPYRPAIPVEQSLQIMTGPMEGHFDPLLLQLWVDLVASGTIEPDTPISVAEAAANLLTGDGRAGGGLHAFSVVEGLTPVSGPWPEGSVCSLPAASEEGAKPASQTLLVMLSDDLPASLEIITRCRESYPHAPLLAVQRLPNARAELEAIQAGAQECVTTHEITRGTLERRAKLAAARHRHHSKAQFLAERDELTGLYNRRGFFSEASRRLRHLSSSQGDAVLIFADLDGLKWINDTLGHAEGDRAIMEFANVLRVVSRESDVVARLSGDEFASLNLVNGGVRVVDIMGRVEYELGLRNQLPERRYPLSASVGGIQVPGGRALDLQELLLEADRAMYDRKRKREVSRVQAPAPALHVTVR